MIAKIIAVLFWPFYGGVTETLECFYYGRKTLSDENSKGILKVARMLPVATIAIGLSTFVFSFIQFVISGGYVKSFHAMKEYGLTDDRTFLQGNYMNFYNKYLMILILLIVIAELITMLVLMWRDKEEKIFLKIASLVLMVLGTIVPVSVYGIGTIIWSINHNFTISEDLFTKLVYAAVICAILSCVLAARRKGTREYVFRVLFSTLAYFASMPLMLYMIENIIGVAGMILACLLIFLAIGFFSGAFALPSIPEQIFDLENLKSEKSTKMADALAAGNDSLANQTAEEIRSIDEEIYKLKH